MRITKSTALRVATRIHPTVPAELYYMPILNHTTPEDSETVEVIYLGTLSNKLAFVQTEHCKVPIQLGVGDYNRLIKTTDTEFQELLDEGRAYLISKSDLKKDDFQLFAFNWEAERALKGMLFEAGHKSGVISACKQLASGP